MCSFWEMPVAGDLILPRLPHCHDGIHRHIDLLPAWAVELDQMQDRQQFEHRSSQDQMRGDGEEGHVKTLDISTPPTLVAGLYVALPFQFPPLARNHIRLFTKSTAQHRYVPFARAPREGLPEGTVPL